MKNKKNIAMYARVGNYEQLESPIDIILDQARRGEIQTVLVSSLERLLLVCNAAYGLPLPFLPLCSS